jgi:ATP-binding protein involved in chromosome partitioning
MLGSRLHLSGVSHVLAVASGKGGVGKTTVAVNLALALRQAGRRVGLYDADLYGPNVPLMLGVRRKQTVDGWIPVYRAGIDPYIQPLERFGLRVMSIGFVMSDADAIAPDPRVAGDIIRQTLQDVIWDDLDFLLIDLPPGTGEPQQTLLRTLYIDGVLIVTTPQDLSLMDASRSLGLFRRADVPILGVIENMSYLNCPHCGKPVQVFHRSERAWGVQDEGLPLLGRVPMDVAISRGIDAGHPLVQAVPDSPQALAFREIASRVAGMFEPFGDTDWPTARGTDA